MMKQTVIVMLILSLFAAPILAEELPLPNDAFKKSSAEYFESGLIQKCKLSHPVDIQNMPCRQWVHFHENGRLAQCTLSEAKEIQGIMIPSGSTVFLREDGSIEHCWLSKDTLIQGLPCDGGFMKVDTAFHENGKISCCFLAEPTKIQGVPCKAGVFKPVQFYKTGMLKACSLSREYVSGETVYQKGQSIGVDENGDIFSSK